MSQNFSYSGFGIGLRPCHYQDVLTQKPRIDWFEIISEDFMVAGGSPLYYLDEVAADYPLALHGVSLSIGSSDPLNSAYLKQLGQLIQRVDPLWVSDHFCWTGVNGVNLHDLMPLPYTEECIEHVVKRVKQVQETIERPLVLENVSSYVSYRDSSMPEWEFITRIAEQADCYLLLDINNIYVNAFNHQYDAREYIDYLPKERVVQYHLAGHDHCQTHVIDTHDSMIVSSVWDLYAYALRRFGSVATLIERDGNIPPLIDMLKELDQARAIAQANHCEQAA